MTVHELLHGSPRSKASTPSFCRLQYAPAGT